MALQGWWWRIPITGADRPNPGLVIADLAPQSNHASLLIKQQQIAVTTHQLQHDHSRDGITWTRRQLELDHAFIALLHQPDKGHLAQAVLNLLRQGASCSLARWRRDLNHAGCFRLPAEFQPNHSLKTAKSQLKRRAVGLLGFLEAAGQQLWPQISQHRPQGGEIHWLQLWLGAHPRLKRTDYSAGPCNGIDGRGAGPAHRDHRSQWCR